MESPVAPTVVAPRQVTFNLRDAALVDVLHAVAAAARTPVVITPNAQPIARCARVTLLAPEPVSVERVEGLLQDAIRSASLEMRATESGWVVARGEGPEPHDCMASNTDAATKSVAEARPELDSILQGIRQVGEHRYEIRRGAIDGILENQAVLMRSARIVPDLREGKVHGIRLFGLRQPSVLGALGFVNGDAILRVGGLPITSPDKALEAYAKVRNADVIEVDIHRRGRAITLTYQVIPDP